MLLPDKHIRLSESLLALGGFVLTSLQKPKTIDIIWSDFQKINNTPEWPAYHSFENLVLAVDFLFAIGAVAQTDEGKLKLCA